MDRRNFLRLFGGGLAGVAAAPTKAYSFLGGILRPRRDALHYQQHPLIWAVDHLYTPVWKVDGTYNWIKIALRTEVPE